MSHRSFAQLVNWPPSLLSDLIHGHRGLSVARAIEFGQYFKMTSVEIERLVMMALADPDNARIAGFVKDYMSGEGQAFLQTPNPDEMVFLASEEGSDPDLLALHAFLIWTRGRTTAEEIADYLIAAPNLRTPEILTKKLEILRRHGIIDGEFPEIRVLKPNLACKSIRREDAFKGLMALRPIAEDPKRAKATWIESRLIFPREDYPEFCQRLESLMNWVLNSAQKFDHGAENARRDWVPLQLNFLVTHLVDLEKAGFTMRKQPQSAAGMVESIDTLVSPEAQASDL